MNLIAARYDDTLMATHADYLDTEPMSKGCHYDYQAQTWRDGHDHAHYVSNDDTAPLMFCGADFKTCQG
jgi:hypothetical protein